MECQEDDIDVCSVEFTLEDTYEYLKDLKNQKADEVKKLMNIVENNHIKTLGPNVNPEEIQEKRLKFIQSMEKFIAKEQPKDLPIPNTPDFYSEALKGLEAEVRAMNELNEITDNEITSIKSDIAYMEKKKAAIKEMKEAALKAVENEIVTNYDAEMAFTKRLFLDTKRDLGLVVDILFPNNKGFQNLLCTLTRALTKGGEDLYIDAEEDKMDFINFLDEAAIIQFHPHDKRKIKLSSL